MSAGFIALMVATDNFGAGGFGGATDQRRRREAQEAQDRERNRRLASSQSSGIYPTRSMFGTYTPSMKMTVAEAASHLETIAKIYDGPVGQIPKYDWSVLKDPRVTDPIVKYVREKKEEVKPLPNNRYRQEPKKEESSSDVLSVVFVISGILAVAIGVAFKYFGG